MIWLTKRHLAIVIVAAGFGMPAAAPTLVPAGEEQPQDAPEVKVVTPHGTAYVMTPAGNRKVLLAIEITDVAGTGIRTTSPGTPYFLAPNRNVAAFLSHILSKSIYTNHLGQEVTQIASLVPVEKLQRSQGRVRPPIDFKKLRPTEGEREFIIGFSDSVECAKFNFQVEDLRGVRSEPSSGELTVGFASRLWSPPEETQP